MTQPPFTSLHPDLTGWVRKTSPLVVIVGDSNQGKTRLCGSLAYSHELCPIYYIDADGGKATIAAIAEHPDVCTYRDFSQEMENFGAGEGDAMDEFRWLCSALDDAARAECGSIVIEGLSRFYTRNRQELMLTTPATAKMSAKRVNLVPAHNLSALIGKISKLKGARRKAGAGVPIIATLNMKVCKAGEDGPTWLGPAISENKARELMEAADFMGRLRRADAEGSPGYSSLQVDPEPMAPEGRSYYKVRSSGLAQALRSACLPHLPMLFHEWAIQEERERTELESNEHFQYVAQLLARNKASKEKAAE